MAVRRKSLTQTPSSAPKVYIDAPRNLDICCGRGKGFFGHPGNQLFQKLVRENVDRYERSGSKNSKSEVVSSIVQELFSNGARFVKRDSAAENWYILSPSSSHEKTGHAIRDHIIQRRKQARASPKSKQATKKSSKKARSMVASAFSARATPAPRLVSSSDMLLSSSMEPDYPNQMLNAAFGPSVAATGNTAPAQQPEILSVADMFTTEDILQSGPEIVSISSSSDCLYFFL